LLLALPEMTEGRSYGYPAFLLHGRFFARFRDDDTVLVLALASIADREFLMQLAPQAFFFTDHYRNYPAVLIRLADVTRPLLRSVVKDAWGHAVNLPPARPKPKRRARASAKSARPKQR
jgi:hypothetical protein